MQDFIEFWLLMTHKCVAGDVWFALTVLDSVSLPSLFRGDMDRMACTLFRSNNGGSVVVLSFPLSFISRVCSWI